MQKFYRDLTQAFLDFHKTVEALRNKETGCAWDLEQTFSSLRPFMIEEAYEAGHEMTKTPLDASALSEELGDVLFQVFLNSQLGKEADLFDLLEVTQKINAKIKRRHPHVFGSEEDKKNRTNLKEIHRRWAEIKAEEAAAQGKKSLPGFFGKLNSPGLPPLEKARKIGEKSKEIGFDWSTLESCFKHLCSEVDELGVVVSEPVDSDQQNRLLDEIGDVFFTLAQVCRLAGINSELAAEHGNQKFLKRFLKVEEMAKSEARIVQNLSQIELEKYWQKAKN